ncbi:MAG: MaoC family dehydratase [Bacteroidia bacterium]
MKNDSSKKLAVVEDKEENVLAQMGKQFVFSRSFSSKEMKTFAELTGDNNPIHQSEEFAKQSIFKQRIVPGVLLMSMFSKIFGTLPDNSGIYEFQSCQFIKPVYLDETVKAIVELSSVDKIKNVGTFSTKCFKGQDELVLLGEAKVKFQKKKFN